MSKDKGLLHHARRGDVDYIKTVDRKILLKAREDKYGDTVLMMAIKKGNLNLCREILKKCPSLLYHQNNRNWSVLHQAADSCDYKLFDFFIHAGLEAAKCEGGKENMIHFKKWIILESIADKKTALYVAVIKNSKEIVKKFYDVNHQYKLGLSEIFDSQINKAFGWARSWGEIEIIKMLREIQKAQESLQTENSSCTGGERYIDRRERNCSESPDKYCRSLSTGKYKDSAVENEDHDETDLISDSVLYSTAIDLFNRVRTGGDIDYIKTVDVKVLFNSRDQDGMSVLCIATNYNRLDCCEEILKRCPSLLYHQNNNKWSVLHHAAEQKNYKLIDFYVSAGLEAAKSEGGMDNFKKWINLQNRDGNTALILAVIHPNNDIVKKFAFIGHQYKLGLSEIVGEKNRTAWELAMLSEENEMILKAMKGKESIETGNHSGTGVTSKGNFFTFDEVSKHNNLNDCWLLIDGKVYDVTKFFGDHPGGSEVLLKASGKDATTDFQKAHSHSSNAVTMMDKFYVGVFDSITNSISKLARLQSYSRVQLEEFTKDFSQPLGSGGFGHVYKGQFPNGVFIAVKVLKNIEFKEKVMQEQFVAEVETMGKAHHQNLIKLYGYCYESSTKFKALVYDYIEDGSLDKILFEKKLDIPWAKLHNIAKEIAQGISYLHEGCNPRIIHQDIKPANVLIDSNLSPKVIDFGLARLVNMGESLFSQTEVKGSRGYMAPEVNQRQKVKLSSKIDVFSFGMILFDILGSKGNYVEKRWFPGQVWEMHKKGQLEKFIRDCGIEEKDTKDAERLATIALLCVEHDPGKRPKLSNVVKMLEGAIIQLETPAVPFSRDYLPENCSTSYARD